MMWFSRPEFDRYARYMSHGSVRELFSWEEMYGVELPIPDIETQRKIVRNYNVIIDRIKLDPINDYIVVAYDLTLCFNVRNRQLYTIHLFPTKKFSYTSMGHIAGVSVKLRTAKPHHQIFRM